MKTKWIALGLVVLAMCAWHVNAEDKPKSDEKPSGNDQPKAGAAEEKKPVLLMRKKLEYSQKILEGLAVEDFEMIHKYAGLMNTFTHLEKWFWADTAEYRAQLKIFSFANDEMIRMADEKNLEGATLAYTQMTLSCVQCHKLVRDKTK